MNKFNSNHKTKEKIITGSTTPEELRSAKEWNEMVRITVENSIGSILDGNFVAANYPAGFNYAVKQQYYNKDSLSALDLRVIDNDGIPSLADSYSSLYLDIIRNLKYDFSKDDLVRMKEEETAQQALIGTIIDAYKNSGLDDEPVEYPGVMYIMQRIKEVTGTDYSKISTTDFPNLGELCRNLNEYARLATNTVNLEKAWNRANDTLNAIIENMTHPSSDNGGLMVDSKTFVAGWDKLPETEQLLDSLKQGSSITFSLNLNDFSDSSANLHMESGVDAVVPMAWFLGVTTASHEHEYDFSQYATSASELDVSVTYNGITTVAAIPAHLSLDNNKGWFAPDILNEAAIKSGNDATGYMLNGSEYTSDDLFGAGGRLRRMKTYVISQAPVIKLTFHKFDCEQLQKLFEQRSDVSFSLFGGLIHGTHNNDYSFTDYSCNSAEETIEVSITPAPIGSTGSLGRQTAFILGGVVEFYENETPLTDNQEQPCKVVYKKCDSGDGYVFDSIWNPDNDKMYSSDDYIIVPVESVFKATFDYDAGWEFANVIGSHNDRKHDITSWIQLFKDHKIPCCKCVTDGKFYKPDDTILPNRTCYGRMVGGHVIPGTKASKISAGEDVFLLPICTRHNVTDLGSGTGVGYYMKTKSSGRGIILENYLKLQSNN